MNKDFLKHMKQRRSSGILLYTLLTLAMLAAGCEINTQPTLPLSLNPPADTTTPPDTTGGNGNGSAVEVSVTPRDAIVLAGQSEQFFASVLGTANVDVTWTVASGPGSINIEGNYTAPLTIDADTVIAVVKATSKADAKAADSVTVKVARPASGGGGGDTLLPGQICFERDVLPIFQSSCAMSGCHDAVTARDGKVFTNYAGIMREIVPGRPERSEIYEKITEDDNDDRMPPPPRSRLTSEQIETIRTWIEQGAENTRCEDTGGSGCDTVNVTFSATVRPILQNNCVGCHSGANPPRGVNLSSYTGVRAVALSGKLYGVISHAPGFVPMPQGARKLSDCQIQQIGAWINKGAANN